MVINYHQHTGKGLLNNAINSLPIELHIPGYQFCGPGTKLEKRLNRGDKGINGLDAACRVHDIAYKQNKSLHDRHKADKVLEEAAWQRFKAKDAKLGEKASAWAVTTAMKIKRKLGMGIKSVKGKKQKKSKRRQIAGGKSVPLQSGVLKKVRNTMRKFGNKVDQSDGLKLGSKLALLAARDVVKAIGGIKKVRKPRVIPVPKQGGVLPLIPIFAGLSALGALAGGATGVAKAVNDAKLARMNLEEAQRHNKTMEAIAVGKSSGSGLYLKPYRKGYGIYLKQNPKNY